MTRFLPLTLLLLSLNLPACGELPADASADQDADTQADLHPLWFDLSANLTAGEQGTSADNPVPFSTQGQSFELTVTAMGYDRAPMSDFNGCLQLHLTSGILEEVTASGGAASCPATTMPVTDGTGAASVVISRAYDQLRIWVSDEGTAAEPGSFASGSTEAICRR